MEKREAKVQTIYEHFVGKIDNIEKIIKDENKHETRLIWVLKEKHLEYIGSVVLGLNDALVELTWALAGLVLALQDVKMVALAGLIIGIPAAMSMAASEYLSRRSDGEEGLARRASGYTWLAYIITLLLLVLPFFFVKNAFVGLGISVWLALVIILLFNFYISIAKGFNFKKRFLEMAILSLGIAAISFGIARLLRSVFGIGG